MSKWSSADVGKSSLRLWLMGSVRGGDGMATAKALLSRGKECEVQEIVIEVNVRAFVCTSTGWGGGVRLGGTRVV
jgi:hypothetical protein